MTLRLLYNVIRYLGYQISDKLNSLSERTYMYIQTQLENIFLGQ